MGRGAQAQTRQLTDQQLASTNALNQQFLNQQQQVGNTLLPQYQSILNNPGLSPADQAAVTGQSQGSLASAFDSLQQSAQNRLARTRNSAGFGELTDDLARQKGIAQAGPGPAEPAGLHQHRLPAPDVRAARSLRPLRRGLQSPRPHAWHSLSIAEYPRQRFAQQRRILLLARLRAGRHGRRIARRPLLVV